MKWLPVVTLCLLPLLPSLPKAAPPDSTSADRANALQPGAWALQFDINGSLISLDKFTGGVSLKRHFSDKTALRFGIGFGGATEDREQAATGFFTNELTSDNYSLTMEMVLQRYANPNAVVNFYWSVGPFVNYSNSTTESYRDAFYDATERTSWGVGALANVGVEWFAAKELGLHAEYIGSGGYQSAEEITESVQPGEPTSHRTNTSSGWFVSSSGSTRFGLSVYF